METSIDKIGSTLKVVVENMVRNGDLEEKLRNQFQVTANTLSDKIDAKNDKIVEKLQKRLLELEQDNDKIKEKLDQLKSKVEKRRGSSTGPGIQGYVMETLRNNVQGQGKVGRAVIGILIVGYLFNTTAVNLGYVLGPLEKLANAHGCQEYGQVKRASGKECVITWSYQGVLHGRSWKILGICTESCTGITEVVFEKTREDAVKICFQKLDKRLPKQNA